MTLARYFLLGFFCLNPAIWAQAQDRASQEASASVLDKAPDPSTVVAVIDGKPITRSQLDGVLSALPAPSRVAATKDPESFLRQFALMNKLMKMAEARHLDQESPYREQLEYQRATLLSAAGLNLLSQEVAVSGAEAEAYYEAHKADFAEFATKVIYIPFSNALPKAGEKRTSMSESEALALAERLVKDLRGGGDFVAAVKQYSKDEASVARNGDFAKLKRTDNIPQNVKDAVFSMKAGEISDPVRQPNGFYIFRVESIDSPDYMKVAAQINTKVHEEKFRKKMDAMRDEIDVKDIRQDLIK